MKLAEHILSQAEKPYYTAIVFLMTICESIFLFIPPEVFMTPAIIANKRRAVPITLAATLGSIIGGAISYMIGLWLFDSLGIWLIENFASMEKFYLAQQMFIKHGIFLIVLTAVTPIPYKLMCMTAGFISFPFWLLIGVSAIFRTGRFVVVGFLLWRFQEMANKIVKKYFWPITIGAIIAAILGIGLMCII
nr:DedA family protein [Alphaproteobacteria bacterium]